MMDRLFRFKVMRISARDVPVDEVADEAGDLARVEQALTDASAALARRSAEHQAPAQWASPSGSAASGGLSRAEAVELAVQTWRLARRVESLDAEKFPRERKQFADSLRRFQKILESHQVEVVDPVGQVYVDGWDEVEVISWEPPQPGTDGSLPTIKQTISPIVRRSGEIIARGQVVAIDVGT
jgi:hypothetical protein